MAVVVVAVMAARGDAVAMTPVVCGETLTLVVDVHMQMVKSRKLSAAAPTEVKASVEETDADLARVRPLSCEVCLALS